MTDGITSAHRAEERYDKMLKEAYDAYEALFKVARWAKITTDYHVIEHDDFWIYVTPMVSDEINDTEFEQLEEFIRWINVLYNTSCSYTLYANDEEWWFSICVYPQISYPEIVDEENAEKVSV
jgi:hypothetical protein